MNKMLDCEEYGYFIVYNSFFDTAKANLAVLIRVSTTIQ